MAVSAGGAWPLDAIEFAARSTARMLDTSTRRHQYARPEVETPRSGHLVIERFVKRVAKCCGAYGSSAPCLEVTS